MKLRKIRQHQLTTPLTMTLTVRGTATKPDCLAPGDNSKLQSGKVIA